MITHVIDKSKFPNGFDLNRFKDDLVKANLTGIIESIDDKVTHLFINGDEGLNNTKDLKKIDVVVLLHIGLPLDDKVLQLDEARTVTELLFVNPTDVIVESVTVDDLDNATSRDTVEWLIRVHVPLSGDKKYVSRILTLVNVISNEVDFSEQNIQKTGADIDNLAFDVTHTPSGTLNLVVTATETIHIRTARMVT